MSIKIKNGAVPASASNLFLDQDTVDVTFTFKSAKRVYTEIVPAHKIILALTSKVFYTMFFGSLREGDTVEITDASPDGFKQFIKFFYFNRIVITFENIEEIIYLSDKYDINDQLKSNISSIRRQLTNDNVTLGLKLALFLQIDDLKQLCETKIKQFDQIFKSNAFLQTDKQTLKHILMMDEFNCNENDVFTGCMEWARISCRENELDENDPNILRNQLGDCFHLIRFGAMEKEDLDDIINNDMYAALFTPDEMLELLLLSDSRDFKSTKFNQTPRNFFLDFDFNVAI